MGWRGHFFDNPISRMETYSKETLVRGENFIKASQYMQSNTNLSLSFTAQIGGPKDVHLILKVIEHFDDNNLIFGRHYS